VRLRPVLCCLTIAALAACQDSNGPVAVASVIISPDSVRADRGDTLHFTAALFDAHGNPLPGRTITWSSSDTTVVAVGSAGIAIARDTGAAWVRAAADGVTDSAAVDVLMPVATIAIQIDSLTTVPGAGVTFAIVTITDSAGAPVSRGRVRWTSSDSSVVSVSDSGAITAISPGTALIGARGGAGADSVLVHVRRVQFSWLTAFAAGHGPTCGLTSDSLVFCWGDAAYASSGYVGATGPVALPGGVRFATFDAGDVFGCGLTADGTPQCVGWEAVGRLGNGLSTSGTVFAPVSASTTVKFVALSSGYNHTCALTAAGAAYCWGNDGSGVVNTVPTQVIAAPAFMSLSAGNFFTCGIATDSTAYCWGENFYGTLGIGDTTSRVATPTAVAGGLKFIALAAGSTHACGLATDSTAYCWGSTSLGTASADSARAPVAVTGGRKFAALVTGGDYHYFYDHTCGVTSGGTVYCWGKMPSESYAGELGTGADTSSAEPVAVSGGLSFTTMAVGSSITCGLTGTGTAYCWGANRTGNLGDGTLTNRNVPTPVVGQP